MSSPDIPSELSRSLDPLTWVDEHGDALFSYAILRVRDKNLADDLVQETLLAALEARDRFQGDSAVRTWLVGIMRRKIADHFRRAGREQTVSREEIINEFDSKGVRHEKIRGWAGDPSEILEQSEFWEVFHKCTDKMPAPLAEVYCLREIGRLSTEEICNLLDISATNLRIRIYRARASLRHCLDKNWFREIG